MLGMFSGEREKKAATKKNQQRDKRSENLSG